MEGQFWANTQYFNPRQIGGLVLWLDATDPAANGVQPSNGTSLATWVDKSTRGNNFTQGTGANQPTFQTNIINGKPCILANGTTQTMSGGVTGLPTGSQGRTFFIVFNIVSHSSLHYFFSHGTNGTGETFSPGFWVLLGPNNFLLDWTNNNSFMTTTALSDATNYLATVNYTAGGDTISYVGKLNGVSQTISPGPSDVGIPNTINGTSNLFIRVDGFFKANAYIAEIIYYDSSLSAAKMALVNNYITNKWGVAS